MWGTSSPDDQLTGGLGNVIEATEIGDRQLIRVTAEKLSPDNFRLLQQYLPESDICSAAKPRCYSITSLRAAGEIQPMRPRLRGMKYGSRRRATAARRLTVPSALS